MLQRLVSTRSIVAWKNNPFSMPKCSRRNTLLASECFLIARASRNSYFRKLGSITEVFNGDELTENMGADLIELCGVPSDTRVEQKVLLVHLEDAHLRRSTQDLALYVSFFI